MASKLFARVELRDEPTEKANEALVKYMKNNDWRPYLEYWYESDREGSVDDPNLMVIADLLKSEIQAAVWPSVQVWVIQTIGWKKITE